MLLPQSYVRRPVHEVMHHAGIGRANTGSCQGRSGAIGGQSAGQSGQRVPCFVSSQACALVLRYAQQRLKSQAGHPGPGSLSGANTARRRSWAYMAYGFMDTVLRPLTRLSRGKRGRESFPLLGPDPVSVTSTVVLSLVETELSHGAARNTFADPGVSGRGKAC